ncbi:MAG: hypothetical protein AVO33_03000 [delta proteobacterium ML8_F1]|nr:MAG: hypothetical protein AVO33_03000 [delta proteobacterium ML8_F1]
MENSIFRKSSLEKISSPEQLNEYVKVTSGGIWLLLIALFALIISVGTWAFIGTIPETVEVKGIAYEGISKEQMVYAYVPMEVVRRMREGMTVQLSPEYAPREEYGYALGVIQSIGQNPVMEEEILNTFGSLQWVKSIIPEGNPVAITIRYQMDKGELQWSSSLGREIEISNGAYVNISVITKERKPYELLLR